MKQQAPRFDRAWEHGRGQKSAKLNKIRTPRAGRAYHHGQWCSCPGRGHGLLTVAAVLLLHSTWPLLSHPLLLSLKPPLTSFQAFPIHPSSRQISPKFTTFVPFTRNPSSIFLNFFQISSNSPSPSSSSQFQIYSIHSQILPFSSLNSLFLLPFFSNSTNSSSFCPKFSPVVFLSFFFVTNYQVHGTQEEDQHHPEGGDLKSSILTSNKNNSYFPSLGPW